MMVRRPSTTSSAVPREVSARCSRYYSAKAVDELVDGFMGVDPFVAPEQTLPRPVVVTHPRPEGQAYRQPSVNVSVTGWRRKLQTRRGSAALRSCGMQTVEPVFGQIKHGAFWLAFRQFAVCQGTRRGGTGGIGRSSGTPRRHRRSLRRSQLATVPHPLHDQPAHSGPQARPAMGSHHGAHHLPATPPPMRYTPSSTG